MKKLITFLLSFLIVTPAWANNPPGGLPYFSATTPSTDNLNTIVSYINNALGYSGNLPAGSPAGTSGQIQYNNSGNFGGLTLGTGLTSSGGYLYSTITSYPPGGSTNQLQYNNSGSFAGVTLGTGLTFSSGTLSATGATGTPGGTSGQIQYNNAGAFGGLTVGTGLAVASGSLYATGATGTPGGSNTQVQYNNSGVFAGTPLLTIGASLITLGTSNFSSRVGIGSASPAVSLDDMAATDAIALPNGTSAQRPSAPNVGYARYNTTTKTIEGYVNGSWRSLVPYAANLVTDGGAACDGTTNDTTAIQTLAATYAVIYVPGSSSGCKLSNAALGTNTTLVGNFLARNGYGSISTGASQLIAVPGASNIINIQGKGLSIFGLAFNGNSAGGNSRCISDGGPSGGQLYGEFDYFQGCNNNAIGDTSYPTGVEIHFSQFYGNGSNADGDISNSVDGKISWNSFSATSGGASVYNPTGSNSNIITNNRFEFGNGVGIGCYQASYNTYNDNQFDRMADAGISYSQCANFTIENNQFRRNGPTDTYGNDAQIYSNGGSSNFVISGNTSLTGVNDNGTGTLSPKYFMLNNGVDYNATVVNNDMSGNYSGQAVDDNATQVNRVMHDNVGEGYSQESGNRTLYGELVLSQVPTPSAPTIASVGTTGSTTWAYKTACASDYNIQSAASTVGSITTGNAVLSSTNYNTVTLTPTNGCSYFLVYRTTSGGTPSSTGLIASVPVSSGSVVLKDTGLTGDYSSAPTLNNTGTLIFPSARKGTFTCTAGGTIVVSNTNVLATSMINITLNSASGTPAQPYMTGKSSGTSFTMQCGASDLSTYNYTVVN
ncbi:MAG: right-handed parallel beta-helix repeat-containing protein [Patescibacteria group bacterium]|nr:right-handed parallel beta-helix repeat-containing protein [Patescibacteria group bacterium]